MQSQTYIDWQVEHGGIQIDRNQPVKVDNKETRLPAFIRVAVADYAKRGDKIERGFCVLGIGTNDRVDQSCGWLK